MHRARFEEQKTLEEFDFTYNPQIPAEELRNLATCAFVERRESVLLCGPVGVGKTHAAQALGHAACRASFTVLFTKTSAFLRDLAGGRADGSWEPRLRRYLQTNVLILMTSACANSPPPRLKTSTNSSASATAPAA